MNMSVRSSASNPRHVLVVGAGSAGRRHGRNLAALGCRISAVDPRVDRRDQLAQELAEGSCGEFFGDLSDALGTLRPDGVVVATPTGLHVEHALEIIRLSPPSCPILLEKPVSNDLRSASELQVAAHRAGSEVLLGYTWRWWPAVRRIRQLLEAGAVGKVRTMRLSLSAHLEDWHPWESYQDFFMSSVELGGGALLDESHWIDLAIHLLGEPVEISADISRLSDLAIETDDNVEMLLIHRRGERTTIHLDIHGRPHERTLRISGCSGTIEWGSATEAVRLGTGEGVGQWTEHPFTIERNTMFMELAAEFLRIIDGTASPSCSLSDGIAVMRVIEAARESSAEGRRIGLGPHGTDA
jgi:predicted dehydrogenase